MLDRYGYELKLAIGLVLVAGLVWLRLEMVNNGDGISFSASRTFPAPIERVWRAVAMPEQRPAWTTGLMSVDVLKGAPDRLGTSMLSFHQVGRERWQVDEKLVVYNPPNQWVIETSSEKADGLFSVSLTPIGEDQTRVMLRGQKKYAETFDRFFNFWKAAGEKDELESSLQRLEEVLNAEAVPQPSTS